MPRPAASPSRGHLQSRYDCLALCAFVYYVYTEIGPSPASIHGKGSKAHMEVVGTL